MKSPVKAVFRRLKEDTTVIKVTHLLPSSLALPCLVES